MRNILLKLCFVGSAYSGWQRQKSDRSVQQTLEEAIAKDVGEEVAVVGCSRTDAGVHAEEFLANFKTNATIPASKFKDAIQSKLPRDIRILSSLQVDADFNARRNSHEKTYRYQIYRGVSPFRIQRWWQYPAKLPLESLQACAREIVGSHDFSAFCVERSLKVDNRCTIKHAAWRTRGRELYFVITGDRFLHHMVRFLVGAQVEVATGKLTLDAFREMLNRPGSRRAKYPAPADGLYLAKVKFTQARRS